MRFLVYGTGAVGGYLGARLARAGHPVTFLARPSAAEAIRRAGLRLEGGEQAQVVTGCEVLTELPAAFALPTDGAVLLTVKAYDCEAAAEALRRPGGGASPVVCLLNGIGNEETLSAAIGAERVVPATLTTAVSAPAPGVVRIERERGLGLGRAPASERLAQAFREAGVPARVYDDGASMKWSKVPTNIVANASSAILGWTAGDVMRHAGLYRLEVEALREVFRVMRRLGLRPVDLPGVPVRWMARGLALPAWATQRWLGGTVARGRGGKKPSFHFDIGRGRTEARWLNGAVVDAGRRVGVATPANQMLLKTLLDLVESRDDPMAWRDRPERLLRAAAEAGAPGMRGA